MTVNKVTVTDGRASGPYDQERAEKAVRELLFALGEDPDRDGLKETPARVARAMKENFEGLWQSPEDVLTYDNNITGDLSINESNVYNQDWWKMAYGQRYGLEPQVSQMNGWFQINEREGKFTFSSDIAGKIIVLEYISDGLAYDMDSKVPKMAEDALYAYILHAIISTRINQPEYVVQRLKKEKSAKLRNAKIRLSNIKLDEITQVMRGKSKWIKH